MENDRVNDFFYSLLFDVTSRQNIFSNVLNIVQKTFREKQFELSKRLSYILTKIRNESDAVVQHGLIFYAVSYSVDVKNFVVCHYEIGKPRETIEKFIEEHIDKRTDDLLNGKFRSMTEYVEEIRFHLLIELGV